MTPVRENGMAMRQPTIGVVLARAQPEGKIDPVGTARAAALIELLGALAEMVAQRVEHIAGCPAPECTASRALLELVEARALLAETSALLDELMNDWKRGKDVPIASAVWN